MPVVDSWPLFGLNADFLQCRWIVTAVQIYCGYIKNICNCFFLEFFLLVLSISCFFSIFVVIYHKNRVLKVPKGKSFKIKKCDILLYDTTCVNCDFWVKPVWGLGWRDMRSHPKKWQVVRLDAAPLGNSSYALCMGYK